MAKSSRIKRRALQSSKKVRRRRFNAFNATILVIVIFGTFAVLASRTPNSAGAIGPMVKNSKGAADHWHSAVGVNICGTWQPGPLWPTASANTSLGRKNQPGVYAGMHTHSLKSGVSDGLIHMEPAVSEEAGRNATVGRWLEYGGWKISSSSLELWPGGDTKTISVKNGDKCPNGKAGELSWARATHATGKTTKLVVQKGSLPGYKLFDEDVIAIYFEPSGTKLAKLGSVPSEVNLGDPNAGEGPGHTNVTTTTGPATPTTKATGTTQAPAKKP